MGGRRERGVWGLLLRAAGVAALVAAWLLTRWLFASLDLGRHRGPGVLEVGAAAGGFLCFSAGMALVLLGGHLFDRVDVSQRWARRRR